MPAEASSSPIPPYRTTRSSSRAVRARRPISLASIDAVGSRRWRRGSPTASWPRDAVDAASVDAFGSHRWLTSRRSARGTATVCQSDAVDAELRETVPHAHAVAATRRARVDGVDAARTPSPLKTTGGFLSLTGYKLEQVLGRNCRFLQGPRTDARAVAKIRDAIKSGKDVQIVLLNYKIDSTTFWNHFFIAALRDDKGDVVNFLGVQIEVSERVAVGILQNAEGKAKQPEKGPAVQAAAAAAAAQLPPKSSGTKRERGA